MTFIIIFLSLFKQGSMESLLQDPQSHTQTRRILSRCTVTNRSTYAEEEGQKSSIQGLITQPTGFADLHSSTNITLQSPVINDKEMAQEIVNQSKSSTFAGFSQREIEKFSKGSIVPLLPQF